MCSCAYPSIGCVGAAHPGDARVDLAPSLALAHLSSVVPGDAPPGEEKGPPPLKCGSGRCPPGRGEGVAPPGATHTGFAVSAGAVRFVLARGLLCFALATRVGPIASQSVVACDVSAPGGPPVRKVRVRCVYACSVVVCGCRVPVRAREDASPKKKLYYSRERRGLERGEKSLREGQMRLHMARGDGAMEGRPLEGQ